MQKAIFRRQFSNKHHLNYQICTTIILYFKVSVQQYIFSISLLKSLIYVNHKSFTCSRQEKTTKNTKLYTYEFLHLCTIYQYRRKTVGVAFV